MKRSIIRAILAFVIGASLVKFRDEAVVAITLTLGGWFFLAGLVACVQAFVDRRRATLEETQSFETEIGWMVGAGCMIFGVVLVVMPKTFLTVQMYLLAGILIISAVGQYATLASATRYGHIGLGWWLTPSLLLLIGILAIVNPKGMITAPLFIIGWALMVYGVVECINAIMVHRLFKRYAASLLTVEGEEFTEVPSTDEETVVEAEEVTDEDSRQTERQ